MLSVHCPTHGSEVLLSERRITGIEAIEGGHRLRWRCWCGTEGTSDVAGRRRPATGEHLVGRYRVAV